MPVQLSTARFTTKPVFDPVVERCASESLSFTEEEALRDTMWELGEDGHLREDMRFRRTPWGRWMLSNRYLANESLYRAFHREGRSNQAISEALRELEREVGRTCIFCPEDRRFVVRDGRVRFSASELSDQPRVEEAGELERYQTHLPLHTIQAVAASAPAHEWGGLAQEEMIETLGWMRVEIPGQRFNDRMFVARIKGHSMDDGRSGLKDGTYALFELWPQGARCGRRVLVRGSFRDPETGNYALKEYHGEPSDENRERSLVRLVSLNQDRERYPDIELTAENENDIEVVAVCMGPIDPAHFSRVPKPVRRKGQRDINSDEGRRRIERNLGKALQRFFGKEARPEPKPDDRSGWSAELVCLDLEAGGLNVETAPLGAFPSFVKTLQLRAGENVIPVIASNLRHRSWRTPVPPGVESYRWTAQGFEEVLDEDLSRLEVAGPETTRATAFRIDASGVGILLAGNALSPGQGYRLLLPPEIEVDLEGQSIAALGKGWRLWDVKLPALVAGNLRVNLESLGFLISKNRPQLEWIGSPARYGTNGAGEIYPVFSNNPGPVLRISGIETGSEGELTLFVGGVDLALSLQLPAGEEWWVKLDGLAPGAYGVEAVHRRRSVGRTRFLFQVSDQLPTWPSGNVSLKITEKMGDFLCEADGVGKIKWEGDLRRMGLSEEDTNCLRLELHGPVYHRVAAHWDDGLRRRLADLYFDENGALDFVAALPAILDLAGRNAMGTLELDLGEAGLVTLRHHRDLSIEQVLASIRERWNARGADVEKLRGQYPLLRSLWLDPILRLLYHGCRHLDTAILETLPTESGALVFAVEKVSEQAHGLVRVPERVILLAPNEEAVRDATGAGLRDLADAACLATGTREAVITDGLVWVLYEPGRKVQRHPIDLRSTINEGQEADFEGFLLDHAITL